MNRISPNEDCCEFDVSRLDNWEFPMIRYKLEDFVVPSEEDSTCSLGIGLSRFEQIIRRQFDSFRLSDGRMIQGSIFNYFIKNIDGVRQYQVIQKQPDVIQIQIVVDENIYSERQANSVCESLKHRIGSVQVDKLKVDTIPVESSGKFRFIRSEVRDN